MLLLVAHYENELQLQIFIFSGTVLLIYLKLLRLIFSFCPVRYQIEQNKLSLDLLVIRFTTV